MTKLKYLKTHYICTVNPHKRKVWDYKKKKQIKKKRYGSEKEGVVRDVQNQWPLMGYVCPECELANNYMKHYLINKRSLCEKCALKELDKTNESS